MLRVLRLAICDRLWWSMDVLRLAICDRLLERKKRLGGEEFLVSQF